MSEMVERVAKAMVVIDLGLVSWHLIPDAEREVCVARARAAIAAMRESTDEIEITPEMARGGAARRRRTTAHERDR